LVEAMKMCERDADEMMIGGNYFSFPSFEYFEDYQESQERIDGRQEQDVP
jgi:hypothetical protein